MNFAKANVRDFWNRASCGEEQLLPSQDREGYQKQRADRYALEPYIPEFAGFGRCRGQKTLEIGVGLGADHQSFAEGGADLYGIDLTDRAVEHTSRRLALFGLESRLAVGDALPEAIRWAVAAGSLAVRTSGTHASYPAPAEIVALLDAIVSKS